MTQLILPTRYIRRDPPSTWGTDLSPSPSFDVVGYQQKLNNIAGFTTQGEPILRLVWGGDVVSRKAVEWDKYNNPTKYEEFPKYRMRLRNGQLVPIRRWIIEQNTDVCQLDAVNMTFKNLRPTEKGFYQLLIVIADHSMCPPDCKADEMKCFGDYKAPNEAELTWVRQAKQVLDIAQGDPRKAVNMGQVAQYHYKEMPTLLAKKKKEEELDKQKFDKLNEESVDELLRAKRFSGSILVGRHNK